MLWQALIFVFLHLLFINGQVPDNTFFNHGLFPIEWSYYSHKGDILCAPQGTPHMGTKWCKFKQHQAEIGSLCWFSCREGFTYHGPKVTECILAQDNETAYFNVSYGYCNRIYQLQDGSNGPYRIFPFLQPQAKIIADRNGFLKLAGDTRDFFLFIKPGINGGKETISFLRYGDKITRYITYENENVVIRPLPAMKPELNENSFSFWIRPGYLSGRYASFESCDKPGYYLVYSEKYDSIKLSKLNLSEKFNKTATFGWS